MRTPVSLKVVNLIYVTENAEAIRKLEDKQLELLLDENDGQTQNQLAEQLDVDQLAVSRHLDAVGKS